MVYLKKVEAEITKSGDWKSHEIKSLITQQKWCFRDGSKQDEMQILTSTI